MKKNIVIIVLAVLLVIVSVGFGVMYFNTNKDVNVNNEPPIVDNNEHQEENNNQQQEGVSLKNDDIFTYVGTVLVEVSASKENIVIPEGVTEIANLAFDNCAVKSVKIPNTVTRIGDNAFSGCEYLKDIQIPDSVKDFGAGCFDDTLWLKEQFLDTSKEMLVINNVLLKVKEPQNLKGEYIIPEGIEVIAEDAFFMASHVKSVKLPSTLKIINKAFSSTEIEKVIIPEGVHTLNGAFAYCEKLKDITIPKSVVNLNVWDFYGTTWLDKQFKGIKNECLVINNQFIQARNVDDNFVFPDGITKIGDKAFEENPKLTKIVIPTSVREIGEQAFLFCDNLKEIVISDNIKLSDWSFGGCDITNLTIPVEVFKDNIKILGDCEKLEVVNGVELAKFLENIDYDYDYFENKTFYYQYIKNSNKNLKPKVLSFVRNDYFDYIYNYLYGYNDDFINYLNYCNKNSDNFTEEQIKRYKNMPYDMMKLYIDANMLNFGFKEQPRNCSKHEYNATSYLKENNEIYDAKKLALEFQGESWVDGVDGYGIGEKIIVDCAYVSPIYNNDDIYSACEQMQSTYTIFNPYYYVSEVCIENGFCKSKELWQKNSRVKQMKLTLTWKEESVEYILNLEDTMKPQIFSTPFEANGLDVPIRATFEILDVYKGTSYEDTALTTIEFLGDTRRLSYGL